MLSHSFVDESGHFLQAQFGVIVQISPEKIFKKKQMTCEYFSDDLKIAHIFHEHFCIQLFRSVNAPQRTEY